MKEELEKTLFDTLWERHKNPLSWFVRPFFGAFWFYGAYINSWVFLGLGVFGTATSWFWFPKPEKTHEWVERFIDIEKKYITPPWDFKKVVSLLLVFSFLIAITVVFWYHDVKLGLVIFIFGALLKAVWSVIVARKYGIPAAIIGIICAFAAALILYWVL